MLQFITVMRHSIGKDSDVQPPKQDLSDARICRRLYRPSKTRSTCVALSACKTVQYNGKNIAYVSKADVAFLHREIEGKRCYFQHGIALAKGDTVIDVGANIGIFAAQAASEVSNSGRVIACEPVPATFAALQHNMQSLLNTGDAVVTLYDCGVGDGSIAEAEFTLYTNAAGWSTMFPSDSDVSDNMGIFLDNALPTLEGIGKTIGNRAARVLKNAGPRWLFNALWRPFVANMLSKTETCTCRLVTISHIIAEQELEQVDLLKIDVERAELAVLHGISDSDWPKIKQMVLEVHDIDGRLAEVKRLLGESAGFQVLAVDQDINLRGSTLHIIYAIRH